MRARRAPPVSSASGALRRRHRVSRATPTSTGTDMRANRAPPVSSALERQRRARRALPTPSFGADRRANRVRLDAPARVAAGPLATRAWRTTTGMVTRAWRAPGTPSAPADPRRRARAMMTTTPIGLEAIGRAPHAPLLTSRPDRSCRSQRCRAIPATIPLLVSASCS